MDNPSAHLDMAILICDPRGACWPDHANYDGEGLPGHPHPARCRVAPRPHPSRAPQRRRQAGRTAEAGRGPTQTAVGVGGERSTRTQRTSRPAEPRSFVTLGHDRSRSVTPHSAIEP